MVYLQPPTATATVLWLMLPASAEVSSSTFSPPLLHRFAADRRVRRILPAWVPVPSLLLLSGSAALRTGCCRPVDPFAACC